MGCSFINHPAIKAYPHDDGNPHAPATELRVLLASLSPLLVLPLHVQLLLPEVVLALDHLTARKIRKWDMLGLRYRMGPSCKLLNPINYSYLVRYIYHKP